MLLYSLTVGSALHLITYQFDMVYLSLETSCWAMADRESPGCGQNPLIRYKAWISPQDIAKEGRETLHIS